MFIPLFRHKCYLIYIIVSQMSGGVAQEMVIIGFHAYILHTTSVPQRAQEL